MTGLFVRWTIWSSGTGLGHALAMNEYCTDGPTVADLVVVVVDTSLVVMGVLVVNEVVSRIEFFFVISAGS